MDRISWALVGKFIFLLVDWVCFNVWLARERAQSFASIGCIRRFAEKRTLNGQSKDSENAEYELNELAQNNNCVLSGSDPMEDDPTLPRDEVEVMQDNQRRKTGI